MFSMSMRDNIWRGMFRLINSLSNPYKKLNWGEEKTAEEHLQNMEQTMDKMSAEMDQDIEKAKVMAEESEEKFAYFSTDPFISLYGEKAGNWIFKNITNSDMERIYDFLVVLTGLVKSGKGTRCEFTEDKYEIEDSVNSSLLYPISSPLNLNYVVLELMKQFDQKDVASKAKKLAEYVEQYRKMVDGVVGHDTVDVFKKLFLDNSGYHIIYSMADQDILYVKNFIRSLNTNYRLIWNIPNEKILESKLELCKDDNFNEIRVLFNVIRPRISDEKIAHIIVSMYRKGISSEYIHSSVIKLNEYIKKIDNPFLKNNESVGADKVLYSKDRKVRDNISTLLQMRDDLVDVVCDEVADRVDISKLDMINRVFLANLVTTINKISDKDLFVEEDYNNMEVVKVTSSMLQGIGLGRNLNMFPAAVVRKLIKDYAYAAISIINNMKEVCRVISSAMIEIPDEKPVNEEKAPEVTPESVAATEEKVKEPVEEKKTEPVATTETEEVPFEETELAPVVEDEVAPFDPNTMNMKDFLFSEFQRFFRPNEYFMIVEDSNGTFGLDIMNGPNYYTTLVNGEAGIMVVGFIGNESHFVPVSIRQHRDLVFNLIYSNRFTLTNDEMNEVLKTSVDPTILPYLDQSKKYVRFSDPNHYQELNRKLKFIMEVVAVRTNGQIPMFRFSKLKNINYFSMTTEGAVCQKTFNNGSISEVPIRVKVKGNNLKLDINGVVENFQMKK